MIIIDGFIVVTTILAECHGIDDIPIVLTISKGPCAPELFDVVGRSLSVTSLLEDGDRHDHHILGCRILRVGDIGIHDALTTLRRGVGLNGDGEFAIGGSNTTPAHAFLMNLSAKACESTKVEGDLL